MSLELLGAETPPPRSKLPARLRPVTRANLLASIAGGVAGLLAWRRHPVLGFLGGSVLANSTHDVATGERTWVQAGERVGQAVVATASSLALPSHPALGYVAGAVASSFLINEDGDGFLQEWAHRTRRLKADDPNVIDAEVTPPTTALVRRAA